ncbi:MAG: hypothetical protein IJR13_07490 [Bacteroidales bacterium]|nr:hypothetical protein [Bacteroidales bacterium]
MKKIFFASLLLAFSTLVMAQQKVVVFVYSNNNLNEPTNALRSNIETALINSVGQSYIVLDRTDEFHEFMNKEYNYQGEGYVSDNQLIAAGEQMGANKICGVVITRYPEEGYFIECKILDIKERKIEKKATYPTNNERVNDLGIASSQRIALHLSKQLGVLSSSQAEALVVLRVGDSFDVKKLKTGICYFPNCRIGYLDNTRKHGIVFYLGELSSTPDYDCGPTRAELDLLYQNKEILGLNEEYWSCEKASSAKNGWGDWSHDKYYTMDFSNGKIKKRPVVHNIRCREISVLRF